MRSSHGCRSSPRSAPLPGMLETASINTDRMHSELIHLCLINFDIYKKMKFLFRFTLDDRTRFLTTVSGVGFAVMLVFVQVGLFLGLLENASITIDRIDADLWVTAQEHAERRLRQPVPRDLRPARPVGPRRGAGRQPDRLVRDGRPAERGQGVDARLRPGGLPALEPPLERRRGRPARPPPRPFRACSTTRPRGGSAPFAVGDHREFLGHRLKIIGRTARGPLVHDQPDRVPRLPARPVAGRPQELQRPDDLHPRQARPGRRPGGGPGRRSAAGCRTTTSGPGRSGPRGRAHYWVESTGLGLSMFLTVFLGCLVGVVVVAQTLYTSTIEHLTGVRHGQGDRRRQRRRSTGSSPSRRRSPRASASSLGSACSRTRPAPLLARST